MNCTKNLCSSKIMFSPLTFITQVRQTSCFLINGINEAGTHGLYKSLNFTNFWQGLKIYSCLDALKTIHLNHNYFLWQCPTKIFWLKNDFCCTQITTINITIWSNPVCFNTWTDFQAVHVWPPYKFEEYQQYIAIYPR